MRRVTYWSLIGAFDACPGFRKSKAVRPCEQALLCSRGAVRMCYISMHGRLHISPFPARGLVSASLGISLQCQRLVRTAPAKSRCPVPIQPASIPSAPVALCQYGNTDMWRVKAIALVRRGCSCPSQKRMRIRHTLYPGRLPRAIAQALAAAVLTLHVRVAISGGSKLCLHQQATKVKKSIWARRKDSLAFGHTSSTSLHHPAEWAS